jgi:hypothetical protein
MRVRIAALTAPLLIGCAPLPKVPADFDDLPNISRKTVTSVQDLRAVFGHVDARFKACFDRPLYMYYPGPIQIGEWRHTATISESGRSAQIIFEQTGVQSFLLSRLDFSSDGSGTAVQIATKPPHHRTLEPLFAMWIEKQGSECRVEQAAPTNDP